MTSPSPAEPSLGDDMVFERGEAHARFRELRATDPVHWNEGNEIIKGWWDITTYDDVLAVSRQPDIFASSHGIMMYEVRDPQERVMAAQGNGKMLITIDPPRHVRLRKLVSRGFTPRAVSAFEPRIRQLAREILDDAAAAGDEADFVVDMAARLPLAVICEMLGLAREDWPLMFRLTNRVLGSMDPEYQDEVPEHMRGTVQGARMANNLGSMHMFGFFAQALQQRRIAPTADLISLLDAADVDGDRLTDEDILWFCFLLAIAGNETTRNAISGGLLALCEHPDERARLSDSAAMPPSAIEEILRWTSPIAHMARVATCDTEIHGRTIHEGERVVLWYPSANRDEAVFPDADRFDITREPNEHVAFGHGEHFCLGAGLARLEIRVMFEELFERFPDIRLAGPVQRLRSTFLNGIKHMPVALR